MTRATELVVVENFQALTTSLKIAEAFEKDHAHVMRDIHTLIQQMASNQEKPILDSAQMFQESSYRVEGQLRKYPMFLINRDGFSLLAMGFTGVQKENPIVAQLGLKQTPRTALISDPARNIFCVGDCASGASLVVRALLSGKSINL